MSPLLLCCDHPIRPLILTQIKDDRNGLTVELCWNKEDRIGSDFVVQFREPKQKKEFLLTVCHIVPDVSIVARGEPQEANTPSDPADAPDYLAESAQLYHPSSPAHAAAAAAAAEAGEDDTPRRRPLPPRPSVPRTETDVSNAALSGDITDQDLGSVAQLLCAPPPPLQAGSAAAGGGGSSGVGGRSASLLTAGSGDALATLQHFTRTPYDEEHIPDYPVRTSLRQERLRQQARGPHSEHSLQLTEASEEAGEAEETYLRLGDMVEVRDDEDETWKYGVVRSMQGDPLLQKAEDDPNFYVLASAQTLLKVQPEGTDKAFSWRQVRMPREGELVMRRQEKEIAKIQAQRMRDEEDEKARILNMLNSMEMRLEQDLVQQAVERQHAAQRVAARQRVDDPRASLSRASGNSGSPLVSPPGRSRGGSSPGAGAAFRVPVTPPPYNSLGQTHSPPGSITTIPDDRSLLGAVLHDEYARWRHTGGLAGGGEWRLADTKRLLKPLKELHQRMVADGAPKLFVDRVTTIVGNLTRERTMVSNKAAPAPIDGARDLSGERIYTIPQPFKLSAGTKPAVLMSTAQFKAELQSAARRSEDEVAGIQEAYADARANRASPSLPSPSPRRPPC